MPNISLRVIRPAAETSPPPPGSARPLFRGTGDTDYCCGQCGTVIAASMGPRQRVILDTATCSGCGAENEFPAELRV